MLSYSRDVATDRLTDRSGWQLKSAALSCPEAVSGRRYVLPCRRLQPRPVHSDLCCSPTMWSLHRQCRRCRRCCSCPVHSDPGRCRCSSLRPRPSSDWRRPERRRSSASAAADDDDYNDDDDDDDDDDDHGVIDDIVAGLTDNFYGPT